METCETCKWWVPYAQKSQSDNTQYGDCRRRSPIAASYNPGGYTDQVAAETLWPTMSEHGYCGEHQPKEKADD